MNKIVRKWSQSRTLRKITPRCVTKSLRTLLPAYKLQQQLWLSQNPYVGTEYEWKYKGNSKHTLGIIYENSQRHKDYIAACLQMGVSYEVIDIRRSDWIDLVRHSSCDVFMVWPPFYNTIWKTYCDERLRIMVKELGMFVYPDIDSIWLYESKRRTRDWLVVKGIDHPKTWVFFNEMEALNFVTSTNFPLVFKTDLGASANGVKILKNHREATSLVKRAFRSGIIVSLGDRRDRFWGHILLQEYLPGVREWRIVRIGNNYFCRYKVSGADGMHSGSGVIRWETPPIELLDRTRKITEAGNFTSMNVDYFETTDGRYLVNELHTVFGTKPRDKELGVDKIGRYRWNEKTGEWTFERGYFYFNACANLRVQLVLDRLGEHIDVEPDLDF